MRGRGYPQVLLVTKLAQITETVKRMRGAADADRDAVLRRELEGVVLPRAFQLPLSPFMVCRGLHLEKCKVMGSAQKPLWLTFHNAVRDAPPHVVIFKCGDDLRQDQLTLQILRSMDALWSEAGLELKMSPYGCVATAGAQGFIEVVQHSNTLANITRGERFRRKKKAPRLRMQRKLRAAREAYYGSESLLSWLSRECVLMRCPFSDARRGEVLPSTRAEEIDTQAEFDANRRRKRAAQGAGRPAG